MKYSNYMEVSFKALSVNEGFARVCVASFCVQLNPSVDEITDIKIDKRKSSNERILDFLNKTKNPYIFKVNGTLVRIGFSETSRTADDCLTSVLKNLYR